mmetsp:Transcript_54268/g.104908  ORF Transcript_54268/g.104908 Transcript_54268/m.104908 type:complete len:221 (-) Transcript_54268:169-831(-)
MECPAVAHQHRLLCSKRCPRQTSLQRPKWQGWRSSDALRPLYLAAMYPDMWIAMAGLAATVAADACPHQMRPPMLEQEASALPRLLSHQLSLPQLRQQQRHNSPSAAWAMQPSLGHLRAIPAFQALMPRQWPAQLRGVAWPGMLAGGPQQQLLQLQHLVLQGLGHRRQRALGAWVVRLGRCHPHRSNLRRQLGLVALWSPRAGHQWLRHLHLCRWTARLT